MDVLIFTERRSRNVVDPLEAVSNCSVVRTDRSNGYLSGYLGTLRQGRRAMRNRKVDVVLANRDGVTSFIAVLLAWWYDVPVVVRLGGDPWRTHREKFHEALGDGRAIAMLERLFLLVVNRITFSLTSGFVVVSEELRRTVQQRLDQSTDRVLVVHSPVRTERFRGIPTDSHRPRATDETIDEPQIVLTVTNLQFRGKFEGVRTVIPEMTRVLSENETAAYVIAGDGRYYDRLVNYVDSYVTEPDVKSRIYFAGYVDDIADLYAHADVFLYVSYDDGYPNVVLEAQAAGVPVIANAAHGMTEQIEDGKTGRLIDPCERGAVERTVEDLLGDSEQRARLGRNAQEVVDTENDAATIGAQLQRALSDLSTVSDR